MLSLEENNIASPESSSVGALDASRLLHDGRDARNVVPSPDGRDEGQEPEVRAPGLCEPDQSKQHNLHASRDQEEEAGQSICLLGGVRGVRIKDELHLQDGRQESKGQRPRRSAPELRRSQPQS